MKLWWAVGQHADRRNAAEGTTTGPCPGPEGHNLLLTSAWMPSFVRHLPATRGRSDPRGFAGTGRNAGIPTKLDLVLRGLFPIPAVVAPVETCDRKANGRACRPCLATHKPHARRGSRLPGVATCGSHAERLSGSPFANPSNRGQQSPGDAPVAVGGRVKVVRTEVRPNSTCVGHVDEGRPRRGGDPPGDLGVALNLAIGAGEEAAVDRKRAHYKHSARRQPPDQGGQRFLVLLGPRPLRCSEETHEEDLDSPSECGLTALQQPQSSPRREVSASGPSSRRSSTASAQTEARRQRA